MIESISIENFQCHEKLSIDFDPSITSIIGKSRSGKSSIIRALKFVLLNRPSGSSFIKHGTETAKVTVKANGHTIIRTKGKSTNTYHLDGEELKAFGQSTVPEPVQAILNVSEENFQNQHALPFWLFDTPGEVAKKLNEIINLAEIDTTLSKSATAVKKARNSATESETRLVEARKKRDDLVWVVDLDAKLSQLEKIENELSEIRQKRLRINDLIEKGNKYQNLVSIDSGLSSLISTMVATVDEIGSVQKQRSKVESLMKKIEKAEGWVEICGVDQEESERELNEQMQGACPLCGAEILKKI